MFKYIKKMKNTDFYVPPLCTLAFSWIWYSVATLFKFGLILSSSSNITRDMSSNVSLDSHGRSPWFLFSKHKKSTDICEYIL